MSSNSNDSLTDIRRKIKEFPAAPGVYLMKDAQGRVLYIGKAGNLRDRAGSYFQPSADLIRSRSPKIAEMIEKVTDVGYLQCQSDVDAILQEARLIKDIQPPYNSRQTDDKTFPYLEITTGDDFPGIYVTRQPREGAKLYGPFTSSGDLRRVVQVLQRIFKFRTCKLEINADDPNLHFFRPCILYQVNQCTSPCAGRISRQTYAGDIKRLRSFLESKRSVVLRQLHKEMLGKSHDLNYEEAARLRDEIKAIESLADRGEVDEHVQPELFQIDTAAGLDRLSRLLGLPEAVRIIEGVDIAHIAGHNAVGGLVCFIDGHPFKNNYRRFRIRETPGIDDYAMIKEVLRRRYRRAGDSEALFPDVILIDGGLGQLHAALEAFENMLIQPPMVLSLAKKEEKIFCQNTGEPFELPRNDPALHLLQYVRDEAHRFAQHYFHILRQKQTFE
jgi:excinuclease ABC subunit C